MEASEILPLDLRADLAIMSGTKVAGTAGNNGAGLMGLSWAFFVGVALTLWVDQWRTDSPISTELMVSFHRRLKDESGAAKTKRPQNCGEARFWNR